MGGAQGHKPVEGRLPLYFGLRFSELQNSIAVPGYRQVCVLLHGQPLLSFCPCWLNITAPLSNYREKARPDLVGMERLAGNPELGQSANGVPVTRGLPRPKPSDCANTSVKD